MTDTIDPIEAAFEAFHENADSIGTQVAAALLAHRIRALLTATPSLAPQLVAKIPADDLSLSQRGKNRTVLLAYRAAFSGLRDAFYDLAQAEDVSSAQAILAAAKDGDSSLGSAFDAEVAYEAGQSPTDLLANRYPATEAGIDAALAAYAKVIDPAQVTPPRIYPAPPAMAGNDLSLAIGNILAAKPALIDTLMGKMPSYDQMLAQMDPNNTDAANDNALIQKGRGMFRGIAVGFVTLCESHDQADAQMLYDKVKAMTPENWAVEFDHWLKQTYGKGAADWLAVASDGTK
ncbi:hypothetical protein J5J86_08945 [Aquabacter sp. L1I39]|uniref:hypothetical protein n=1 Tax=Aquabacter sp. L1I39 TaxID=2820278 RepID=UPI001ADAB616|nr:hypothetical protein [Aquabacter sp. L1I39]QTL05389.1 hypothetical protein J5J86_08945 [Aquabacter sp. L1I39]